MSTDVEDLPYDDAFDGCLSVTLSNVTWVARGSELNTRGFAIKWVIEIEVETGIVRAVPRTKGFRILEGPSESPTYMAAALGCVPRVLGTIGPLAPFFPNEDEMRGVFQTLGLPFQQVYVATTHINILRRAFAATMLR